MKKMYNIPQTEIMCVNSHYLMQAPVISGGDNASNHQSETINGD